MKISFVVDQIAWKLPRRVKIDIFGLKLNTENLSLWEWEDSLIVRHLSEILGTIIHKKLCIGILSHIEPNKSLYDRQDYEIFQEK